jgi:hypothetical protein
LNFTGTERLSDRKLAQFVVPYVVLAAVAGTAFGYSANLMLPTWALLAGQANTPAEQHGRSHVQTAAGKSDKLNAGGSFALAATSQIVDFDRPREAATAPAIPFADTQHTAALTDRVPETKHAALARPMPLPVPPPKATRNQPSPSAPGGLLDDGQIAGLKDRLRLTSDQVEYWPAVESALRHLARTHLRDSRLKQASGGKVDLDVNSPEVQQLIWAARPLIVLLREDQKREVRKLARVIGLESVASRI